MKLMRSKKAGSLCSDCGSPIEIGDPIAYYGPHAVFGLTCHKNEKSEKMLKQFLAQEQGEVAQTHQSRTPPAQEWCIRLKYDPEMDIHETLIILRYAERHGEYIVLRAPRSVGLAITKQWAEQMAEAHSGEAVPYWVEED